MSTAPVQKVVPSYGRHWLVVFVVVSVLIGWRVYRGGDPDVQAAPPGAAAMESQADWFLLVRCPEMPMEAGGAQAGQEKLTAWIQAAREAGFHLMGFTEVQARLQRGESLPENTVVLSFDPAYRHTIEQLLPALTSLQVPALWVTQSSGRIRADRRFVPPHTRRVLSAQPLWDVAVAEGSNAFVLEKVALESRQPREFEWNEGLGITGVNSAATLPRLNRLHANARWSAPEFVSRLKSDVPLRQPAVLSAKPIGDRLWGVVQAEDEDGRFALRAPSDRRHATLAWEGTRGVLDAELNVEVNRWFGEMWVLLRWDRERDERVRVGLSDDGVRVLQERGDQVLADTREGWPVEPDNGVRVSLRLNGDKLQVRTPLRSQALDVPVLLPGTSESVMALSLYHRIHGAAVAEDVQVQVSPLSSMADPVFDREIAAVNREAATATATREAH